MHGVGESQPPAIPCDPNVTDVSTMPGAVATPPVAQTMPQVAQSSSMAYPYPGGPPVPAMNMNAMAVMSMHHSQMQMMGQPMQSMQLQPQMSMDRACQKKTRLVWTPELHKRFLFAVERIGLKVAVPRTILQVLQVMGVDGLTRENIASHLQKYRRLLEKKAGLSGNGPIAPNDWPKLESAQSSHLTSVRKQMEEERRQKTLESSTGQPGKRPIIQQAERPVMQFMGQNPYMNGGTSAHPQMPFTQVMHQPHYQPQLMMPIQPLQAHPINQAPRVTTPPVSPQPPLMLNIPMSPDNEGIHSGVPLPRPVMPPPMYVLPQGDGTPMLLPMLPAMYAAACGMNHPSTMGQVPLQGNVPPGMGFGPMHMPQPHNPGGQALQNMPIPQLGAAPPTPPSAPASQSGNLATETAVVPTNAIASAAQRPLTGNAPRMVPVTGVTGAPLISGPPMFPGLMMGAGGGMPQHGMLRGFPPPTYMNNGMPPGSHPLQHRPPGIPGMPGNSLPGLQRGPTDMGSCFPNPASSGALDPSATTLHVPTSMTTLPPLVAPTGPHRPSNPGFPTIPNSMLRTPVLCPPGSLPPGSTLPFAMNMMRPASVPYSIPPASWPSMSIPQASQPPHSFALPLPHLAAMPGQPVQPPEPGVVATGSAPTLLEGMSLQASAAAVEGMSLSTALEAAVSGTQTESAGCDWPTCSGGPSAMECTGEIMGVTSAEALANGCNDLASNGTSSWGLGVARIDGAEARDDPPQPQADGTTHDETAPASVTLAPVKVEEHDGTEPGDGVDVDGTGPGAGGSEEGVCADVVATAVPVKVENTGGSDSCAVRRQTRSSAAQHRDGSVT